MGQFWVPESAVGHNWSNFQPFRLKFGLCALFLCISPCKTGKTNLGPICAPFRVLTLFGAQKLRGIITMETAVCFTWNLAGFSFVMISKRWLCLKFLIWPLSGPLGKGQFWVPESAVGHKMEQFSTVSFQICTVHMISGYLHLINRKDQFGANLCPFFFYLNFFYLNFFLPNFFFFTQIFFCPIFFFFFFLRHLFIFFKIFFFNFCLFFSKYISAQVI